MHGNVVRSLDLQETVLRAVELILLGKQHNTLCQDHAEIIPRDEKRPYYPTTTALQLLWQVLTH